MVVGFLPEIVLFSGIIVGVVGDILPEEGFLGSFFKKYWRFYFLILLGVVFAILLSSMPAGEAVVSTSMGDMLALTRYSQTLKGIVIFFSLCVLLFTWSYEKRLYSFSVPFYLVMLTSVGGSLIALSATNIFVLYLGVEIQSLPLYVMAGAKRHKKESLKAAVRYFFVGSFASILLLMGGFVLYRSGGSIFFSQLNEVFSGGALPLGAKIGCILILVAFFIKMGLAPFHSWLPLTYSCSPTPATVFFLLVVKSTFIGLLAKFLLFDLTHLSTVFLPILRVVLILSLLFGALGALQQRHFKMMMGYASIATTGVMILPFISSARGGLELSLSYLILYNLALLLVFFLFSSLYRFRGAQNFQDDSYKKKLLLSLEDLKGLGQHHKLESFVMSLAALSLSGLPLFGSFVFKMRILIELFKHNEVWLIIGTMLMMLLSFGYYLRLIYYTFSFRSGRSSEILSDFQGRLVFGSLFLLVPLCFFFFYPSLLAGLFKGF